MCDGPNGVQLFDMKPKTLPFFAKISFISIRKRICWDWNNCSYNKKISNTIGHHSGIENISIAQNFKKRIWCQSDTFHQGFEGQERLVFVCTVLILQKKLVKYCDCLVFYFFAADLKASHWLEK
jgi:hypothetical protein